VTPFFSPDGRWIGFFAQGKLEKISVSGGAPITLCDAPDNRGAAWGPDDSILFTPTAGSPIESIPAAGGTARQVTNLSSAAVGDSRSHRYPEFLPGGKAFLFDVVYRAGNPLDNADIAVASLETGQYRILLHGGSSPHYVSGEYIIYAHGGDLLAVPFDASRLAVTGPPTTVVHGVAMYYGSGAAHFAISSNGTLIYLPYSAQAQPKGKLVWVNRQGIAEPIWQTIHSYSNPRLLPGDKQLIVEIDDDIPGIWSYDIARDTLSPLAIDGGNDFPVVSRDGRKVAYRSIRNGSEGIFARELQGSGTEKRFTTTTRLQRPDSFSPDGTLLAFTEGSATQTLLKLLPLEDPPAPVSLLSGMGDLNAASISRDGRWIAYVSDESGQNEVYVQGFPGGGGKTQLSSEGGAAPLWSHDGRELFYRHRDQLLAVEIKTGAGFSAAKPQELFEGRYGPRVEHGGIGAGKYYRSSDDEVVPDYDVTEDGKKFLMIQATGTISESAAPRIEVVLNWIGELRRIAGKTAQ
jgi:Tol biopolymer transport system component